MWAGSSGRQKSGAASDQVILNSVHRNWGREKNDTLTSCQCQAKRMWAVTHSPVLPVYSPGFTEGEPRVHLFWAPPERHATEHTQSVIIHPSVTARKYNTNLHNKFGSQIRDIVTLRVSNILDFRAQDANWMDWFTIDNIMSFTVNNKTFYCTSCQCLLF